jgi:arsenate reductase
MLREWAGDKFEAFSAGTEATAIRPEAIQVMDEIGIDISSQESKSVDTFRGQPFEWFITVCDEAQQNCPVLPGVPNAAHWSIEDPSAVQGSEEEKLGAFRQARDRLRDRLRLFILAGGREDVTPPVATTLG